MRNNGKIMENLINNNNLIIYEITAKTASHLKKKKLNTKNISNNLY